MDKEIKIDPERLSGSLEELAVFGVNEFGGLDRTTFTKAELQAREWLKSELRALDLDVRIDEAANIWGRRKGDGGELPSLVFGSHIDTVPNGGKYDGALGVLIALEIMKVLKEHGVITKHPLELVSFTAEEPNPFGLSTFGSRAITGKLTAKDLDGVTDSNGYVLTEALQDAGGDPVRFEQAIRRKEEIEAYLEVHIEQGKRLLNQSIPLGVVTAITGIYREEVKVVGDANHAGTTLMNDRKDALAASAEMVIALERICREYPKDEVVGTVGKLNVSPNSANIIPAEVTFILEIRGKSEQEIKDVLGQWSSEVERIKENRSVQLDRKVMLDQAPAPMDNYLVQSIEKQATHLSVPSMRLGSMAGHDATHMASITRSVMLFVPSTAGKSHCPEEHSEMDDIEKVANVLLHTLLALDKEL